MWMVLFRLIVECHVVKKGFLRVFFFFFYYCGQSCHIFFFYIRNSVKRKRKKKLMRQTRMYVCFSLSQIKGESCIDHIGNTVCISNHQRGVSEKCSVYSFFLRSSFKKQKQLISTSIELRIIPF